ncbi:peptidase domain-containing ABC transporter [Mycoplasmoides pneumoniae]|uniref:peptidase domain-containing ABC transporter n=1 Tax=Mycoplasmoides pneumoniae TaxID=2104 RepID=UPI000A2A42DD|nr:peptidase domain-containing ABC transporter [Mycoplasmoides pneumoniae]ARQ36139.1 ABC transporter ATP-binding protein [Mycoplasmoides pneumoniae]
MKIIYQEQPNECGICVLGMLANELHEDKYAHDELLEQINLPASGLSFFELETYGKKFGLEIASYQLTLEELKQLEGKYFIVHFPKHFVVVHKKQDNLWEVFDPAKGKYLLNDEELKKQWTGYAATVQKSFKEIPPINKRNFFKHFFDLNLIIFYVFIKLIIIGISTLLATASKTMIANTVDFGTSVNIVVFVVFFLVLKGLYLLLYALLQMVRNVLFWKQYRGYLGWIMQTLQTKSFVYFSNKSPNQLTERQFYLKEVLSFFNVHIPNLIISCTVALIIGTLIGINQMEFLWIAIAQIVVNCAIFLYDFFFTKRITKQAIPQMELQNKVSLQLDGNLRDEQNGKRFNYLMMQLRKALIKNQNISNQKEVNHLASDGVKSFAQQVFDFLILALGIIGIIEQRYTLAFLFYIFSIQALFSAYATRIIQFGAAVNLYQFCKDKLVTLFEDKVNDCNFKVSWKCPKVIKLNNCSITLNQNLDLANLNLNLTNGMVISGENGSGKSTLLKILTGRGLSYQGQIKLDELDLKDFSASQLFHNVYYLTGQLTAYNDITDFGYSEALLNCKNPQVYQLLADTGIHNQIKLSSGQKQILQLFLLQNLKDKVILLDETLNAIATELKPRVYQLLIKPLTYNNFVLMVEHDLRFVNSEQDLINLSPYLQQT